MLNQEGSQPLSISILILMRKPRSRGINAGLQVPRDTEEGSSPRLLTPKSSAPILLPFPSSASKPQLTQLPGLGRGSCGGSCASIPHQEGTWWRVCCDVSQPPFTVNPSPLPRQATGEAALRKPLGLQALAKGQRPLSAFPSALSSRHVGIGMCNKISFLSNV